MSAQIETSIEGHVGVIALNRPEAINALNPLMISAISGVLRLWEGDDKVRALLFELSGQAVGAADALALGLTDCAVAPDRLGEVRASIVAAASAQHVDAALVGLMEAESIQAGDRVLCDLADRLEDELRLGTAAEVVTAIEESGEAPELAMVLGSRSPTSQEAILQSHLAARRVAEIGAILEIDRRLAQLMAGLPDFAEGVRAVLVDKDHTPRWQAEVPRAEIAAAIAG